MGHVKMRADDMEDALLVGVEMEVGSQEGGIGWINRRWWQQCRLSEAVVYDAFVLCSQALEQ